MKIIKFDEIDSTQKYIKDNIIDIEDDTVVCAKVQTAGRGRTGNIWQSKEGGLWFSCVFDVSNVDSKRLELFTMFVGVSVFNVLKELYDIDVKLKWPNDLYINGKKLCGIIAEIIDNKVIIGIGINTNISKEYLITTGTSLLNELNKQVDNGLIMMNICEVLIKNKANFDVEDIVDTFRNNMIYKNEKYFIKSLNKEVIIKDVDENGALVYEENGTIKTIDFGEI
ncbi:MAG: biotin--[Clostridia bacterium]|nr:biotin--[acetyl-CoA-carboxylase] ligase [Clostridia bacterium]